LVLRAQRKDKWVELLEECRSATPREKRPKNRQHDAVTSPVGSGFDLNEGRQIDNPNLAILIPYEFRVFNQIGVVATVMQAAEYIERSKIGNQPNLAT